MVKQNHSNAPVVAVLASYVTELIFEVAHLPRPGETVGGRFTVGHGGKGLNMAVAAQRCGAITLPVMKTGEDEHGRTARKMVADEGMSDQGIFTTAARPSGAGVVLLDAKGQNSIALDAGANFLLTPDEVASLRPQLSTCRVFLAQLESPVAAILEFFRIAREVGAITILNPAPAPPGPLPEELWRLTDCLTPNQTEGAVLSGGDPSDQAGWRVTTETLRKNGVAQVAMTLGAEGAFISSAAGERWVKASQVSVVDTTGAGDAFNGALAAQFVAGATLSEAVEFAVRYAALKVTRRGTALAMPTLAELSETAVAAKPA